MNINDILIRLNRRLGVYQNKLYELVPDDRSKIRLDRAEQLMFEVMGPEVFQAMLVRTSCQELEHLINTINDWKGKEATKLKGNKDNGRQKGGIQTKTS